MGCDIHAYIEHKPYNNYWEFAKLNLGRHYALFSLMAGVRGKSDDSFPARGLPKDMDPYILYKDKVFMNGLDGHSHSWLSLKEFKKCVKLLGRNSCNEYRAVIAMMEKLKYPRLVFCFDN